MFDIGLIDRQRRERSKWLTGAVVAASLFLAGAAPAVANCNTRLTELAALAARGETAQAEKTLDDLKQSFECKVPEETRAEAIFSDLLLENARKLAPKSRDAAFALIQRAASFKASWSASAALGDELSSRREYVGAAQSYQQAIELLPDSADASAKTVSRDKLTQLNRRAEETRHLAASESGVLVRGLRTRDLMQKRGLVGGRVPAPILFVYKKDAFTPVGEEAARELADFLKQIAPKTITLFGHTDPIGSHEYNMDLSLQRGNAVKTFLVQQGFNPAAITVVPKGKTEPVQLSSDHQYSQEQIYELDRRVEFSTQD
jgi:outer membrane protein OmpA-like peptidoglycan-associated protein